MTKSKSSSKIIILFLVLFAFVISSCWFDVKLNSKLYADGITSENVSVSNGNFDSSSSSYLQSTPSGWSSMGSSIGSVTNGVISVLPTDFENRFSSYGLTALQNPGKNNEKSDDRVLMLNSQNPSNKGYQNSSAISLNANSYYKVSILVKVINGYGSIYATGMGDNYSTGNSFSKIDSTDAYNWTEYNFFVKTGFSSESLRLELRMGEHDKFTEGIIFFDNVSCEKLSENVFYQTYISSPTSILIDKLGSREISNFITTTDFDSAGNMSGWTPYAFNTSGNEFATVNVLNTNEFTSRDIAIAGSDNSKSNSHALLLHNKENGVVGVESQEFSIPKGSLYVLSLNVKLGNLENLKGITINLIEGELIKKYITDYKPQTFSMKSLSSMSETPLKNGYTTCQFLIKGNPLFNTSAKLQILLGGSGESEGEVGSAVFDTLRLFRVSNTEFKKISTNSTSVSANFTSSNSTQTISNGNFNDYEVEKTDGTNIFPATPANWTHTGEKNETTENSWQYGVINLEQDDFEANKAEYGLKTNIGSPSSHKEGESNNVLMLRNKSYSYQTLQSSSFTFTANTFQTLSFEIKTLSSADTFNIYVIDETNDITIFEAKDVSSMTNWTKYVLQIKTTNVSETFIIKFEFGTKDEQKSGHVFIDNVRLDNSKLDAESFDKLENSETYNTITKKIDLSYGMYSLVGEEKDGVLKLNAWKTSSTSSLEDGVAGLLSEKLSNEINPDIKNILYLETHNITDYSLAYKFPYSFKSGSYYKVSLKVKTSLSIPEKKYDENGKEIINNYGLSISFSEYKDSFNYVVENGEWQTYTFFLAPKSDLSSILSFTLTSTGIDSTGKAYIGDLLIEDSTETEFNLTKAELEENKNNRIIATSNNELTDDPDKNPSNENGFNWLLVPSLLLSFAVILALTTFVISKFRFKKYEIEVLNEYNRESTLEKDIIKRQAKEIQEKEVVSCTEKLNLVKEELSECETEYSEINKNKTNLTAKEKEKVFKAFASKRTKIQNKLIYVEEELSNIKSEDHFAKIEKKILMDIKTKNNLEKKLDAKSKSKESKK